MRIALIIGCGKTRDLRGYTELKIELEKRGHDVKIMPVYYHWEIHRFLPHLIVLPNTTNISYIGICRCAKKKNIHVVDMRAEGTVNEYVAPGWAGKYSPKGLSNFTIVWGEKPKDLMVKYGGRKPEKTYVCGNPRFDKYLRPLLTKEDFCKENNLDPNKKIILYANNLTFREGVDYTKTPDYKDVFRYIPDFDEVLRKLKRLRNVTIKNLFDVIKHFPDINFIIKLHPFDYSTTDEFEEYTKKFDLKNVLIYTDEIDISDAISVSDIFLHWSSTSSAEAWFMSKPTISVHFDESLDFYLGDIVKGSDLVRDKKGLIKKIEYYLKGGEIPKRLIQERERFIKDWYYKVDGKSTKRAADVIDQYLSSHTITPKPELCVRDIISFILFSIKKTMGLKPYQRLLFWKPVEIPADEEMSMMEIRVKKELEMHGG